MSILFVWLLQGVHLGEISRVEGGFINFSEPRTGITDSVVSFMIKNMIPNKEVVSISHM